MNRHLLCFLFLFLACFSFGREKLAELTNEWDSLMEEYRDLAAER